VKTTDLTCIVCGNGFEPAFPGSDAPNITGGLLFHASGQYGSDFDSTSPGMTRTPSYLLIAVCDSCLRKEGDGGRVILGIPQPRVPNPDQLETWNPDADSL
jgi:hypothetical protein